MESYGPTPITTYNAYDNKYLIRFIDDCTRYVSNLSPFLRYILWRYTIGSASVNSFLIFGKQSDNAPYWTYLFFKYHFNTFGKVKQVPGRFKSLTPFFNDPQSYKSLPKEDQFLVADVAIRIYIETLQSIIKKGPRTQGEFRVFKTSTKYPGLPESLSQGPVEVLQQPFNSTTVLPYFDFAIFMSPESNCCIFDLLVPKGSRCLYIPPDYHAYPFEHEILLPFGVSFEVDAIVQKPLHYIDKSQINLEMIQSKDTVRMGPVFQVNEFYPCKQNPCVEVLKPVMVYEAILISQ